MVYCRIYSVFYYFGSIVLCLFLNSYETSHRRCGSAKHPLPDSSIWVHIFRRVRKYHRPLASRSPPAFPPRPQHHRLFRCHFPWLFGFDDFQFYVYDITEYLVQLVQALVFAIETPQGKQCLFFGLISPLDRVVDRVLLLFVWSEIMVRKHILDFSFHLSGIRVHGTFGPFNCC